MGKIWGIISSSLVLVTVGVAYIVSLHCDGM